MPPDCLALLRRLPLGIKPHDKFFDLVGIEDPGAGLAAFPEHGPRQQDARLLLGERLEEREMYHAFEHHSDNRRLAIQIFLKTV